MARIRYIAGGIIALSLLFAHMSVAGAFGRDADGSRMQARAISLGSSASDSLSPPGDSVDWRYVRVPSSALLTVSVSTNPSNASARVSLTDSVGKTIRSGTTRKGKVTLRSRVEPGLYYMSVSSSASLKYTLSVR